MSIFNTPNSADPTAELDRLAGRAIELLGQQQSKATELAAAEQESGAVYLDGGDPNASVERLIRLRGETEGIARALGACDARRLALVEREMQAQVADLRRQAAQKRAELEKVTGKVARLLAQVAELEGVAFMPSMPISDISDNLNAVDLPRSRRLQAEIETLERRAKELETEGVPNAGDITVEAGDGETVIRAAFRERKRIPPAVAILRWAERCIAAARKVGADQYLTSTPVEFVVAPGHTVRAVNTFRLVWREEKIEPQLSALTIPAMARRTHEHAAVDAKTFGVDRPAWTESWFDSSLGAFRAELAA